MGFLDHSTNNIIVDAVLTDAGRKLLASTDNSFEISFYALGDDEVDYGVIQQYGRTIGKEKIEKNTPVMEALTAGSLALKHKLITIDNEWITHLPILSLTLSSDTSATKIEFSRTEGQPTAKTLNISATTSTNTGIDPTLLDSTYLVEVNHLFLYLDDSPSIIYSDNIAQYEVDSGTDGLTSIIINRKAISPTVFNTYSAGNTTLTTYIKVTGYNSGITKTFPVTIT